MTLTQKKELITQITDLLNKLIEVEQTTPNPNSVASVKNPLEMLTVKECAELVSGLTEHTVRQLVKQNKVSYIRCGQGARGKILVSKDSLLKYLSAVCA